MKTVLRRCWPFILWIAAAGCGDTGTIVPQPPDPLVEFGGTYPPELVEELAIPSGLSAWTWCAADDTASRAAELRIDGTAWLWRLVVDPDEPDLPVVIRLRPDAPDDWHDMLIHTDVTRPGEGMPLPRRAIRSPHYADLLHLLQSLTAPHFDQHVTHWFRRPVPVAAGPAESGEVDLRTCLREAVEIWNAGTEVPLFEWAPDSARGVRLVHFAGFDLHPPMSASLVQRDDEGRALRLQIRVGDTYDSARDVYYARRGLVHELAHALLLWGHSEDRDHVVCGVGPFTDRPSDDERRAVGLRQALPAGMDLGGYGRSTEIEFPGQQGERASVVELGLEQQSVARQGVDRRR